MAKNLILLSATASNVAGKFRTITMPKGMVITGKAVWSNFTPQANMMVEVWDRLALDTAAKNVPAAFQTVESRTGFIGSLAVSSDALSPKVTTILGNPFQKSNGFFEVHVLKAATALPIELMMEFDQQ